MLSLTRTPGGVLHFTYDGPCGVSGVAPLVQFDLTAFQKSVRADRSFREQLLVEIEAQSSDVTDAVFQSIQPAAPALPEVLNVLMSSTDAGAEIAVRVVFPHSSIR